MQETLCQLSVLLCDSRFLVWWHEAHSMGRTLSFVECATLFGALTAVHYGLLQHYCPMGTARGVLDGAAVQCVLGAVTVVTLVFATADYGRHAAATPAAVPCVPQPYAWLFMELPTLVHLSLHCYHRYQGPHAPLGGVATVAMALFGLHYVNRALVYPLRMILRGRHGTAMPLHVPILANLYCSFNGHLQTADGNLALPEASATAQAVGVALFLVGLVVNHASDEELLRIRERLVATPTAEHRGLGLETVEVHCNGRTSVYALPQGRLFRWVACPNYAGEILEWFGFALVSNSLVGFSFFAYTMCNLVPRAVDHDAWYARKFGTRYTQLRRAAVIPFLL
jgi:hypothetical protein